MARVDRTLDVARHLAEVPTLVEQSRHGAAAREPDELHVAWAAPVHGHADAEAGVGVVAELLVRELRIAALFRVEAIVVVGGAPQVGVAGGLDIAADAVDPLVDLTRHAARPHLHTSEGGEEHEGEDEEWPNAEPAPPAVLLKIGRASCRERVEIAGGS